MNVMNKCNPGFSRILQYHRSSLAIRLQKRKCSSITFLIYFLIPTWIYQGIKSNRFPFGKAFFTLPPPLIDCLTQSIPSALQRLSLNTWCSKWGDICQARLLGLLAYFFSFTLSFRSLLVHQMEKYSRGIVRWCSVFESEKLNPLVQWHD